jgi:hypothetical protein
MTSPSGPSSGPDATVGTVHQPRPLGAVKPARPTQKNLGYSQSKPKTRKGKSK